MLKNAGLWTGIVFLGYSALLFFGSFSHFYYTPYGPGPGFLPRWLGGILFIVTMCYIWDSLRDKVIAVGELFPRGSALYDIELTVGGLCIFAVLITYTGFVISAGILLFLMTIRHYKWYYALPVSIVVAFIILTLFQRLLGVPLPVNEYGF
ncbi:MAG TPA: tripartite tricarboxylate transporter TctB family protein [Negativicutes bacterium]|nr:tripartite tricarboxylate transporter TctB family protein [Negativicutes bacterium]